MAGDPPHGAISSDCDDVFQGVHVADESGRVSGEQSLFLAVIARCWRDAFHDSDWFLEVSDKPGARPADIVRAEARRWLTASYGDYTEDRETVCDLAGLDPDMLRDAARRKLKSVKESEQHTAEIVRLDAMFARLLDDADTMDSADIDAALIALADLESAAA